MLKAKPRLEIELTARFWPNPEVGKGWGLNNIRAKTGNGRRAKAEAVPGATAEAKNRAKTGTNPQLKQSWN